MSKKSIMLKARNRISPVIYKGWIWISRLAVLGIGVIGLSGLPGDLETWLTWIDKVMNDPRVIYLAEYAVEISQFVNQLWVRGLLITFALTLVFWGFKPFWNLRHKIKFRWRKIMADQVWISEKEAMEIMKRSAWGRLLEPNVTEKLSIFELVSMGHKTNIVHGLSDTKKALLKFDLYIQKTLGNFSEINPKSYNKKENKYDEVAIRKFVTKAMDAELAKEFGAPPSIIVD